MKKNIHPTYYPDSKVKCSCGNEFEVGAATPKISVEICSKCHYFYTGQEKFVDTAGKLERFRQRLEKTQLIKKSRSNSKKTKNDKKSPRRVKKASGKRKEVK